MMEKIQELIYLPSVRCNLNCRHCKEIQDIKKDSEADGYEILKKFKESFMIQDNMTIIISGGEPFLNSSFEEFILKGLKDTKYTFDITTNGYFCELIWDIIQKVQISDRERLVFHVSVDGMEMTHNKIRRNEQSFQRAVRTVQILTECGIKVFVNTVIQQNNLLELETLQNYFKSISERIIMAFIPMATDISELASECVYTKEYLSGAWRYMKTDLDRKKMLSKGKYGISACHAGMKNVVIGPDAKVFTCVTGAYYKEGERENFLLGDLKENTLDEIWMGEKRLYVLQNAVKRCAGCTNPCEVNREVNLFNQPVQISKEEIPIFLELEQKQKIGSALLDMNEWFGVERYQHNHFLCWSAKLYSKVYLNTETNKKICISYQKLDEGIKVKIFFNEREVFYDHGGSQQMQITLNTLKRQNPQISVNKGYDTLAFLVDRLDCPNELWGNGDKRHLGIGLQNITFV